MRNRSSTLSLASALVLPLLGLSAMAQAQVSAVPSALNFQGRLTTPPGTPVPDGTYSVRFSLHDALTGGTEKYNKTVANVQVKNGVFAITLNAFPAGTFDSNLWLEVKIGNDAALTPRTPLVSVPYALKSDLALTVPDGSLTASKFASGELNDAFINVAWMLGGNGGINPSQFLGTTDAQPIVFKTDNTERLRIDASGNLGIGTSTPGFPLTFANSLGDKISLWGQSGDHYGFGIQPSMLQIYGDHVGSDIVFGYGQSAAMTETMRIKGSGNVGVGTADPQATLDVNGTARMTGFQLTANATMNSVLISDGTGNGTWGQLGTDAIADGSITEAKLAFAGGASWLRTGNAGTYPTIDFLGTTDDNPFAIRTNNSERVYITSNGNVGIGTSDPQQTLSVSGTLVIDQDGYNSGFINQGLNGNGLIFGSGGSGEGIGSNRGGDTVNVYGLDFYTSFAKRMVITNSGKVGIGAANPSHTLTVAGDATFLGGVPGFYALNVEGDISCYALFQTSDARYKTNIAPLPDALDTILNLRGVTYDWNRAEAKGKNFGDQKQVGFLAQEMERVLPVLVRTDKNGDKAVNYTGVIPVLVEAVKILDSKVKRLEWMEAENAELKARLDLIERALAELRANR